MSLLALLGTNVPAVMSTGHTF